MASSPSFVEHVLDQLSGLDGLASRRMFGELGLTCHGTFFGIVADDRLYFRTGEASRAPFVERGMGGFVPRPGAPPSRTYLEVPADVLEDDEELVAWARRAVEDARA